MLSGLAEITLQSELHLGIRSNKNLTLWPTYGLPAERPRLKGTAIQDVSVVVFLRFPVGCHCFIIVVVSLRGVVILHILLNMILTINSLIYIYIYAYIVLVVP